MNQQASGHTDHVVRLWDARSPQGAQLSLKHKGWVGGVAWSAHRAQLLLSACHDGTAAGLECRPPSLTAAPRLRPRRLCKLSLGLSSPKQRLISSEAKEASWKAAGRSAQNEPSPL